MSTDIELLPLPRTLQHADDADLAAHVQDYARANVAHHTAKLQAEIEALRAEVATWEGLHASEVQVRQRWQARAERLAEALRELCNVIDGHEVPVAVEGKAAHARAALRDHDQEVKGG